MNISGIRISDKKKSTRDPSLKFLSVSLSEILEGIYKGFSYHWVLLFLDGSPEKGWGPFLSGYKNEVNHSKNGLFSKWEELNRLNSKFFQIYEITLLGSKDPILLKRYLTDEEMYKKCELVVELVDCSFWEVHAHDEALILALQKKFKQTELLS